MCLCVCALIPISVYSCETMFQWSRICLQKHDLRFACKWVIMCLASKVWLHLFELYVLRIVHLYCTVFFPVRFISIYVIQACECMHVCGWVNELDTSRFTAALWHIDWNLLFMDLHFLCEIRVYSVKREVNLQCFSSQPFPSHSPHLCLFSVCSQLIWLLFPLKWFLFKVTIALFLFEISVLHIYFSSVIFVT